MSRTRLRRLAALGVAAVVSSPASLAAQIPPLPDSTIQAIISARVAAEFSTGIVAGVLRPDGTRAFLSEGTSGRPLLALDQRTVFEIGSLTKAYTGTLLAQMAVDGDVALEDPVVALLPDSVTVPMRGARAITLVDLATHTSALPRLPANFAPADPRNPYADYGVADLYGFLSGLSLTRGIGTQYEYSNLGAGLLGHALARKAGSSYEEALRTRVLAPAGLDDTRITLTPEVQRRLAVGHDGDGAPVANWDLPTLAGAGALRSTAEDVLDFLAANMDARAPNAEAYRMAWEPRRDAGPGMRIGLGWHLRSHGDRVYVWHNGQTGGYHSFAAFDPASKTAVVVLSNSASNIDDIGWHVLDPGLPLVASRSAAPVQVAEAVLERYTGVYELSPAFRIQVTREGDRLFAQATNQPRFRLFASAPNEFFLRVVEARVTFELDSVGTIARLVLHQGGRSTPGAKIR
jgi:serine-type D-Ala-D-Ala carboxypeptidase/endopeptidase